MLISPSCSYSYRENVLEVEAIVTEVAESSGASLGGGVAVLNSGHSQELLGDRSRDDAGTARSRDETDKDGTALA